MFQELRITFKADFLKLKKSGIFWMLLITSCFIPIVNALLAILIADLTKGNSDQAWSSIIENNFKGYGGFFFPLLIILLAARITQLEHKNNTWKLIETLPIKKRSIYFSKWLLLVLMSLFSLIILFASSILCGLLVHFIIPEIEILTSPFPFKISLLFIVRLWIATLGLAALQLAISTVVKNFITPFIIGLIGIIAAGIINTFFPLDWLPYYSSSNTVNFFDSSMFNKIFLSNEWTSLAWMAFFLWFGFQWYSHKKFKIAFVVTYKKPILLLFNITVLTIVILLLNKPIDLKFHNRTVITGNLEGVKTNTPVYIIHPLLQDTLYSCLSNKNKFTLVIADSIQATEYIIVVSEYSQKIFFGNKDSLYLNINLKEKKKKAIVYGTRYAENNVKPIYYEYDPIYNDLVNNGYKYDSKKYIKVLLKSWNGLSKKIKDSKTSDNIKPKDDFINWKLREMAINFASFIDIDYPKTFKLYFPNDSLVYPSSIQDIKKYISIEDTTQLSNKTYVDYLKEYYKILSNAKGKNANQTYLNFITNNVNNNTIKSFLLNEKINEIISSTSDSTQRKNIVNIYLPFIQNKLYQKQLVKNLSTLNKLVKGMKAPDFNSFLTNDDTVTLKWFEGRYVVFDVWATWCGPCKQQEPFYNELAEMYSSNKLIFATLSIDEEKYKWSYEVSDKSKSMVHLWVGNKNKVISESYFVRSIPRYILISPEGKIVNANMPRPSESEFAKIILKEVYNTQ